MPQWVEVCAADEIDEEDVIRFDHGATSLAVYRSDKDGYYATEGFCTHGKVHLADGLVMGRLIECPKHNGRFDYATGQAIKKPACEALKTYPVNVDDGRVYVRLD